MSSTADASSINRRRLSGLLLVFVAHVMQRRGGRSAAIVMAARCAGLRIARGFLLSHVVRHFGLRSARVMVTVLLGVACGGLSHRGSYHERGDREGSK